MKRKKKKTFFEKEKKREEEKPLSKSFKVYLVARRKISKTNLSRKTKYLVVCLSWKNKEKERKNNFHVCWKFYFFVPEKKSAVISIEEKEAFFLSMSSNFLANQTDEEIKKKSSKKEFLFLSIGSLTTRQLLTEPYLSENFKLN